MIKVKKSTVLFMVVLVIISIVYFTQRLKSVADTTTSAEAVTVQTAPIDQLTAKSHIVNYLKSYKQLPTYYITKQQAIKLGWNAAKGNLCQVAPNQAIGGDRFVNREKLLPMKKGRIWYEADINYYCGRRGADRLLYSNDGLIYSTFDHYRSVKKEK